MHMHMQGCPCSRTRAPACAPAVTLPPLARALATPCTCTCKGALARAQVATLRAHTAEVCGLAWSANGQQLASGGNDNLVRGAPPPLAPLHLSALPSFVALRGWPWRGGSQSIAAPRRSPTRVFGARFFSVGRPAARPAAHVHAAPRRRQGARVVPLAKGAARDGRRLTRPVDPILGRRPHGCAAAGGRADGPPGARVRP
eukprot:328470-Prymnesium_polylepis.1